MSLRQWSGVTVVSWILGIVIALAGGHGTAFAQGTVAPPRAALSVWDTGRSSAKPLAAEDVEQKNGWKPIASGETTAAFEGDAAISNGRLLALARNQGSGVELYSLASGKPVLRTCLLLTPGAKID